MHVWTARWVLPVAGRPVRDGALAVADGRIAAVGERRGVLEAAGAGAAVTDLGEAVVLPGLVNAHVHLELSWLAPGDLPAGEGFAAWARALIERRETEDATRAHDAARHGAAEMVRRGTAAVGDVGNHGFAAPLLAAAGLHGVAFLELYGFRAADAGPRLERAAARLDELARDDALGRAVGRLLVAPTPHAASTTSGPLLRALVGRAAATGQPLSIHVAESREEVELLADGSGPLAELLRERAQWDDAWRPPGVSPVRWLDRLGALGQRTLAVHCVQLDHQDRSILQSRGVTVVTCPRSNAALGVGRAPVMELLGEGVPVAVGTDGLASAPDLDPFAELAALRREHPRLPPAAALRMATLNGARALGVDDRLGTLERGKLARCLHIPLVSEADDPYEAVCSTPERVEWLGAGVDGGAPPGSDPDAAAAASGSEAG